MKIVYYEFGNTPGRLRKIEAHYVRRFSMFAVMTCLVL